jgi:hypothetical protein
MIPEIAIIGHPNEGKSSVLSTLAEDDSVRISPIPGETTECRTFPVIVDGREMIRFTDTPGFQNPGRVLSELKKRGSGDSALAGFMEFAAAVPELHDDRELLIPVQRGAGIIYVVDGSRPVRNVDRAEMEILRLIAKPRMAIINCKEDDTQYLDGWKNEFRQNFNANRVFNAHRATYAERILLLEALKSIDQDWQGVLAEVVSAFRKDWAARTESSADIIVALLHSCLQLRLTQTIGSGTEAAERKEALYKRYTETLTAMEKKAHRQMRSLYKHNIFNYELPSQSLVHQDLFDERTWQLLGLTRKQVVIAGSLGGAAIGAGLEMAAFGHGLGIFTAVGTLAGAVTALLGGESMANRLELFGMPLGGEQLQVGPPKSIDLLFVLLNRALLFYQHTINWAHGRRDYDKRNLPPTTAADFSFTSAWSATNLKICNDFFKAAVAGKTESAQGSDNQFRKLVIQTLQEIDKQ